MLVRHALVVSGMMMHGVRSGHSLLLRRVLLSLALARRERKVVDVTIMVVVMMGFIVCYD